jgi:hypothetical protein
VWHIRQPARSNTAPARVPVEQQRGQCVRLRHRERRRHHLAHRAQRGRLRPAQPAACAPATRSELGHGMGRAARSMHRPAKSEASPAPGSSLCSNARAATSVSALAGEFAHGAVPPPPQLQSYAPPQRRLWCSRPSRNARRRVRGRPRRCGLCLLAQHGLCRWDQTGS